MKTYSDYIDSGVEWMGKIPKGWKVTAIKHAFDVVGSGTTPSVGVQEYYDGNIPWVNTGDLNDGVIKVIGKYITPKALEDYSVLKTYPKGSIVIAMYGATIGKLGILPEEATVNQACCVLNKKNNVDTLYAFYSLMVMRKSLIAMALGGGQPNISQDMVKNAKIPVMPGGEKVEIVSYLDTKCVALDKLIATKEEENARLKIYRQSVITKAVTKGLNSDAPMKDSGVEWMGEVPEGWKVQKIKGIATIAPALQVEGLDGNSVVNFLPMECLRNGKYDNLFSTMDKYSSSYNGFNDGDIVMAKVTPCFENGNIAIVDNLSNGFGFGTSEIFVIRAEKVINRYLFYYLQNERFKQAACATMYGVAGLKRISSDFLRNMKLCLPTENEQKDIIAYLDTKCVAIDRLLKTNEQIIAKLKEYKQALIYEVVTGKRRVS